MTLVVHRILPARPIATLQDYVAVGGGQGVDAARKVGPATVVAELEASGLRGRGGAGFPTGRKWRTVVDNHSDELATTVVVNAAEGEPGTFKDRAILLANPYQVLEGALIAAVVTGAREVVVATKASFTDVSARVRSAIDEVLAAGWVDDVDIRVHEGPSEYLFGEETALLESIDGRPPFPRIAPPFRRGVVEVVEDDEDVTSGSGLAADVVMAGASAENVAPPALVDNVETFANVPGILREGAAWFREMGTEQSPGTIVCTVTGAVATPGVAEVPMGVTLQQAIDEIGGGSRPEHTITAVLTGVSSAPVPRELLEVQLTYEAMAKIGSGLGSAGYIVLDDDDDVLAAFAGMARFLAVESCGQCTPCKEDGLAISDALDRLSRNVGEVDDVDVVRQRVRTVANGARCSIGIQEEVITTGLLTTFASALDAHVTGTAPAAAPMVIGELVTVSPSEVVVDRRHADKQPDWTYEPEWSGDAPVDRFTDHRSET
ncbi:MAG: NADH-ubiquinone oxidoreductase-F iron-sulfur binding region domain-containing protein [Acidimicrobiales bacterium]